MELGDEKAAEESDEASAEGDFVGDDEVIDVDEGGDEESAEEDGVDEGDFWRILQPDCGDAEGGDEFDPKITRVDFCAAAGGFSAQ